MLRITWDTQATPPTLKLEGKLLTPWVEEVRRQCDSGRVNGSGLRLDLSGLSFVDRTGAALLRDLRAQGARIVACSNYLAELLELERKR